ncbi:PqqD family peptide modification chaperone [Niallia taxi]|nr:PqqD family peptide modification chaperone [Niallia taxi]MDE5053930.1 PqqD family peptide modification chaperone [Niallia taxi]
MSLEKQLVYKIFAQMEKTSLEEIEGIKVICNKQKNTYYQLGEIGLVIWGYISKPVTIEQIITKLMEEFEVIEIECRNHVDVFIDELLKEDLIYIIE